MLDLKPTFFSILSRKRRRMFIDKLEKSNKAKIEVSYIVSSSMFTSCIMT